MARLRVFRRLIWPSAWPLLHGSAIAFLAASMSRLANYQGRVEPLLDCDGVDLVGRDAVCKNFVEVERGADRLGRVGALPLDRSRGGVGLGLGIVRDLARTYKRQLRLDRSSLGGLAAILVLPVAPTPLDHTEPLKT
jgi:hypothetical protein